MLIDFFLIILKKDQFMKKLFIVLLIALELFSSKVHSQSNYALHWTGLMIKSTLNFLISHTNR